MPKIRLAIMILIIFSSSAPVTAQIIPPVLCDMSFIEIQDQLPASLEGTFYRVLRSIQEEESFRLEYMTQTGIEYQDIPIPADLKGQLFPSSISPDGRYLIFEPLETNLPIFVWKIGTSELAVLQLSPDDIHNLNRGWKPLARQTKKLTWIDNTHLLMQYFALDYEWFDYLIAEKTFTIVETPLEIQEGGRINILYPPLDPPEGNVFPAMAFSPQDTYVTLVSQQRIPEHVFGQRFQIYRANTMQPVAGFQPTPTRGLIDIPLWTPDEKTFFMTYRSELNLDIPQLNIVRVDANQGFAENYDLQQSLESTFGLLTTLSLNFAPTLNEAGTKLAVHIYVPEQQQYYMVIYNLETEEISVLCDTGEPIADLYYPIWGPHNNYFGYWNNGQIHIFDIQTGLRYSMNGEGFVGWLGA